MGGDVVDGALEALGVLKKLFGLGVGLDGVLEFLAGGQRLVQGRGFQRYHPGDAVHVGVGHSHGAAHVPERGLGAHGAEADDLGHPVVAVLGCDVVQYLVAAVVLEVHVDVRHLLPFQVQEPLEDQPVLQGIDAGDAQAVEDHAGGGAAADAEQDAALAHEPDDVPDHQEVVGEAGVLDHLEFVLQAVAGLLVAGAVVAAETLLAEAGQVLVGRGAVGRVVPGQVGLPEVQGDVAALGDGHGIGHGVAHQFRVVAGEQGFHFGSGLDVVGVVLHAEPVLVVAGGAGLDPQVDVLQRGMALVDVVGVVGGDDRDSQVMVEVEQALVDAFEAVDEAVLLQLEVVVLAEYLVVPAGGLFGGFVIALCQQAGDLGGGAAGEAGQALGVGCQQLAVDAGPVIEPLGVGHRDQLHEVPVAGVVPGQQHQVVRAPLRRRLVVAALVGHVHLAGR